MPQHSIPIFAPTATGTGQLQQGLRFPPLLGRDVTAVQGSLGNTAPAQDTDNTLGWVGLESVGGLWRAVCDQPLS